MDKFNIAKFKAKKMVYEDHTYDNYNDEIIKIFFTVIFLIVTYTYKFLKFIYEFIRNHI